MSKPHGSSKGTERSEPKPAAPLHPAPRSVTPPVSGHPKPHPPSDASEPEAKAPAQPIANDLLQKAQQAAPATGGGKMGPAQVVPQAPLTPGTNPLGMTQPAEESEESPPERVDAKTRVDVKTRPLGKRKPS